MINALPSIFAIEVDGKPTVAVEARNLREANEMCEAEFLIQDLRKFTSNGTALCGPNARLRARFARSDEVPEFPTSTACKARLHHPILAYLVPLDNAEMQEIEEPGTKSPGLCELVPGSSGTVDNPLASKIALVMAKHKSF